MQVISINVGQPKEINWKNQNVTTSIFKDPTEDKLKVSFMNIDGDKQSDLRYHGGIDKAVYAYASEHYQYWQNQYPDLKMNWGMFGENLTVKNGLFENQINIGDCFQLGSIELMAVQPRYPCYKLGVRFGFDQIIKKFLDVELCGVYFRVIKEGYIQTGDNLTKTKEANNSLSISLINQLLKGNKDKELLKHAISLEHLASSLKEYFQFQLNKIGD